MKTYKAIKRSTLTDKDAQRIGEFIEQRFGDDGATAYDLVEASRNKRAATHRYFEWDNEAAGHEYRLIQARHLLRSVEVVVEQGGTERTTRAFHNVTLEVQDGAKVHRYVPQEVVWKSPELTQQVITSARRELDGWVNRYEQYTEISAQINGVRQIAQSLAA